MRPVRTLVVDDDQVDAELTRRLLAGSAQMRFDVSTANGLREALQMLRHPQFDVLLLDLNLPGSMGLPTIDAVRVENCDVPIIVLTSVADEDTALCSLDHGAQDYLVKGNVTTETLVHSIRYAIQRQQLLQELTNAKALLEKKNQRLADLYQTAHRFVDNLSHEFRTPLAVIKEYTSIVRDGLIGPINDEQRRFLDVAGDRADDLNTMVDDMLDMSKLEAGLLGAWRRSHDLCEIIENLKPSLERKALLKRMRLETEIDEPLPMVYCDAEKINRVIINLTVNAIKFCQENGNIRIWAKSSPNSSGVLVGVTDNGPGIEPENLSAIFERFRQLNTNPRVSCKGFGLGLNIAKELVDLNFGEMHVESELGKGSTFTFTIPPADPLEVMRRYLYRITSIRNGSADVSLVSASVSDSASPTCLEDVEAYLQGVLRRNDLLFRIDTNRWLIVVAVGEFELDKFYFNLRKALKAINRNRLQGPLPELHTHTEGTWRPASQFHDVFARLRELLESKEPSYV